MQMFFVIYLQWVRDVVWLFRLLCCGIIDNIVYHSFVQVQLGAAAHAATTRRQAAWNCNQDKGGGRGRYDGKYDRREQDRDRNRYNRDNDRISHSHRQRATANATDD